MLTRLLELLKQGESYSVGKLAEKLDCGRGRRKVLGVAAGMFRVEIKMITGGNL